MRKQPRKNDSQSDSQNDSKSRMSVSQRIEFLLYRSLSRFAEVIPASAIWPLSWVLGRLGAYFMNKRRAHVAFHLAKITGSPARLSDIENAFAFYVRYWIDTFRLPVLPKSHLVASVEVVGIRHIEEARMLGKGVIFAMPHIGNWDVAAAWYVASGYSVTTVAERIEPPELAQWFLDFRDSLGTTVLQNGPHVGAKLLRQLRNGECVALVCDRDVDGSGIPTQFFGEITSVPIGPAALAIRSGAPILPIACYAVKGGRHRVEVGEPVRFERSGDIHESIAVGTRAVMQRLEVLIRKDPAQWHVFVPNWPSEGRG